MYILGQIWVQLCAFYLYIFRLLSASTPPIQPQLAGSQNFFCKRPSSKNTNLFKLRPYLEEIWVKKNNQRKVHSWSVTWGGGQNAQAGPGAHSRIQRGGRARPSRVTRCEQACGKGWFYTNVHTEKKLISLFKGIQANLENALLIEAFSKGLLNRSVQQHSIHSTCPWQKIKNEFWQATQSPSSQIQVPASLTPSLVSLR